MVAARGLQQTQTSVAAQAVVAQQRSAQAASVVHRLTVQPVVLAAAARIRRRLMPLAVSAGRTGLHSTHLTAEMVELAVRSFPASLDVVVAAGFLALAAAVVQRTRLLPVPVVKAVIRVAVVAVAEHRSQVVQLAQAALEPAAKSW